MKTRTPHELRIERIVAWIGSIPSLVAHTIFFAGTFAIGFLGIESWEIVLLVLTTVVSLEAIYLAIFIQMTVNRNTQSLHEVEEDVDEIHEEIEELGEDVEEIQEDVEDIQEDIEEIVEDEEPSGDATLERLTNDVRKILADLEALNAKK